MSKTILITGAGGYIGRHVVEAVLDNGAKVVACDIYTDEIDSRAEILNANIFSGEEDIFRQLGEPDVCLHMAWKDGFVHNSNSHMRNLSDHYIFLQNMVAGGLKHLAVMGTMHEIGYHEGAIDEDTPCNPTSMYGIAKDALRRSTFLMVQGKDVQFQWLRAFYIYGDDLKSQSIFAKLIRAEQEGKVTFPFTTGKNKYDFIHVNTLAEQIAAVVTQNAINGIINCCTGKPMSLSEKVEEFIAEHGMNIKLEYGAFPDRPYDSPGVWGDSAKIESVLRNI